jgi:cell division protein FtsL
MHQYRAADNRRQTSDKPMLNRSRALFALDTRTINLLLIAATVVMFVSYLALNNQASTKGFMIRGLEQRISALETERQKLELAVVTAHSMDTIGGGIKELGLVPVAAIEYVNAPGGAVAVR